jgi:hypothetical protein
MYSGRKAQLLCELLATIAYGLTAYCLSRRVRATKILAAALYITELGLLVLYLFYVVPLLSGPWPELRSLGVSCGTAFFCITFLSLACVLRLRRKGDTSLIDGTELLP